MRGIQRLVAALAASTACTVYRPQPAPEVRDRPPDVLHVYVVATDWKRAGELGASLDVAGFVPIVVAGVDQVPAGSPWIENARVGSDVEWEQECTPMASRVLSGVTLFLIPVVSCTRFGAAFDLHRSRDAPAEAIDRHFDVRTVTGWFYVLALGLLPGWEVARLSTIRDDPGSGYSTRALRTSLLDALDPPQP